MWHKINFTDEHITYTRPFTRLTRFPKTAACSEISLQ